MRRSLVVRLPFTRVVQQDRQLDLLVQALDHAHQPQTRTSTVNTLRLHQQVQLMLIATLKSQVPNNRQNDPGTIAVTITLIPERKHLQCQ